MCIFESIGKHGDDYVTEAGGMLSQRRQIGGIKVLDQMVTYKTSLMVIHLHLQMYP